MSAGFIPELPTILLYAEEQLVGQTDLLEWCAFLSLLSPHGYFVMQDFQFERHPAYKDGR